MQLLLVLFFVGLCSAQTRTSFTVDCSGGTCPASYTVDGQPDPPLSLFRGVTYTFNVNAPGHPFLIKTTPGSGTANQYTDGVTNAGIVDGAVTFAVPSSAPDLLHYQCRIHGGMNGPLNILSANQVFSVTCQGTCPVDYNVDGTRDPVLTLVRGNTYVFNVNAPGHPFYIKTVPATPGTGAQYTSGVEGAGTVQGLVIFRVPLDAPDTLFYQCGVHANMGNQLRIIGQPCNAQWQCQSLTLDYNFVECDTVCKCRVEQGFVGLATPEDKCRCPVTNQVVYNQGNAYCLSPGQCVGTNGNWQCSSVTTQYSFVQCNGSECECKAGFDGNATVENKCRCDGVLTWVNNEPICTHSTVE